MYEPRERIESSAAKTKTKVERNSANVALMESGCVASSALPKPYALRADVAIIITNTLNQQGCVMNKGRSREREFKRSKGQM